MDVTLWLMACLVVLGVGLVLAGLLMNAPVAPTPREPKREDIEDTQRLPRPTGRAPAEFLRLSKHSSEDRGTGTQRLAAFPAQVYWGRPVTHSTHGEEIIWRNDR